VLEISCEKSVAESFQAHSSRFKWLGWSSCSRLNFQLFIQSKQELWKFWSCPLLLAWCKHMWLILAAFSITLVNSHMKFYFYHDLGAFNLIW